MARKTARTISELRMSADPMIPTSELAVILRTDSTTLFRRAKNGELSRLFGGGVYCTDHRASVSREAFLRWYDGLEGNR